MYESDDKNVSHPSHYQSENGIEVIDVIEAFTKGLSGIEATDTGNIIKYACRWKNKGGVQDVKKIIWYATHLVEYLEDEMAAKKWKDLLDEFFYKTSSTKGQDDANCINDYYIFQMMTASINEKKDKEEF